jgi:hypothetical protein
MPLTRDQIDAASDAKIITVDVPELGGDGKVCIRLMSVGDRDSYEIKLLEGDGKAIPDFRSELLSRTLCDDKGVLLYPGDEGVTALKSRSSDLMHRLWHSALKHNALTEEEIKKLAGE